MVDLDVFALANAAVFGSAFLPSHAVLIDHAVERTLLTILSGTPIFARSIPHSPSSSDVPTLANRLTKHIQHTLYACEHALRAFPQRCSHHWGQMVCRLVLCRRPGPGDGPSYCRVAYHQ